MRISIITIFGPRILKNPQVIATNSYLQMRTVLILIPQVVAIYSYSDSDIYLMQELQTFLEWLGTGLVGLLIFVVVLMITQLLHK